ncbi:hypothetical protein F0562_030592 [Nyssa sinensis]|uniref:Uncharacterized protein n=1 Tax=Nyssa sinensis TaxID=561372 RepID=A0A5J5AYY7_9ASTE|nr:hypothetical protein F0562_030592 [Nyssa sinensis]
MPYSSIFGNPITTASIAANALSSFGPRSSTPSEISSFMLDNKVAIIVVKVFHTPVDMAKLVEIRSPTLEYQVFYDFTRVMVGLSKWLVYFEDHTHVIAAKRDGIEEQYPLTEEHPLQTLPFNSTDVELEAATTGVDTNLATHPDDKDVV